MHEAAPSLHSSEIEVSLAEPRNADELDTVLAIARAAKLKSGLMNSAYGQTLKHEYVAEDLTKPEESQVAAEPKAPVNEKEAQPKPSIEDKPSKAEDNTAKQPKPRARRASLGNAGGSRSKKRESISKESVNNSPNVDSMLMRVGRQIIDSSPGVSVRSGMRGLKRTRLIKAKAQSRQSSSRAGGRGYEEDSIKAYFNRIGKYDLLDKDAEYQLGSAMREAKLATARIVMDSLRAAWGRPAMYSSEEKSLEVIKQGQEAKDLMIHANLRLVVANAKKYQNRGLELEELIQEGNFGLERAVDKFDEQRGFKFSTYATWWIKQSITRAVENSGRTIRLPTYISKKSGEVMDLYWRSKSIDEIIEVTGLKKQYIEGIIASMQADKSLDDFVGEDQETRLGELVGDEKSSEGYSNIDLNVSAQAIDDVLKQILRSDREIEIIKHRFGIGSDAAMTLEEIGEIFDISRERVRQLENISMAKLKHPSARKILGRVNIFGG